MFAAGWEIRFILSASTSVHAKFLWMNNNMHQIVIQIQYDWPSCQMCYKYTVNHWKHSLHRAYSLFIMHIGNEEYINAQSLFIRYIQSNLTSSYSGQTMGCICFLSFFSSLGEIHNGRLTDCHSSQTELQSSRGSRVGWITKQSNSSCRWIYFCPCLCFFFSLSDEYMCSLVPQSSTMCIMYVIDCCFPLTGLIPWSRWWNGCRCNSNHKCNNTNYSYIWHVL